MSRNVADLLWDMLAKAGVKRCYGIVGDALNPVVDGLRRNGKVELRLRGGGRCLLHGPAGCGLRNSRSGYGASPWPDGRAERRRSGDRHRRRRRNEHHGHVGV